MPTYDYKCKKCARVFEVVQSMKDAPLSKCEECGGPLKRLIGAGAGLIFKGSGFYCTDYKGKNAGAAPPAAKPAAPAAPAEAKPKTEGKPAGKHESAAA
ncbi:MAG: FmdB family zinc ribbon protein [Lentisphaeria bacterium]